MSIWANPEIWPFFRIRYLNFFFIPVVQEYLNEIAPTVHGPNKLKTSGKPLRIADLQPPASGQVNPATLYSVQISIVCRYLSCIDIYIM